MPGIPEKLPGCAADVYFYKNINKPKSDFPSLQVRGQEEKYSLDLFMCIYFLRIEVYLVYNVILVSGVQQSDSLFFGLYSILSFYKMRPNFSVLYNISLWLIYFIHRRLFLLILYLVLPPSPSLSLLVTVSVFSTSVNLFLLSIFICSSF